MSTLFHRRLIAAGMGVLSLTMSAVAVALEWPSPMLPSGTTYESAGESLRVNGMPTQIRRFHSRVDSQQLIAAFARGIDGKPTARTAIEGTSEWTLGGRAGDFWLTLRWREAQDGTRGTWSAAPIFDKGAKHRVVPPQGFPRSATLLQQVDSFDVDKRSQMAVGIDSAAIDAVALRLEEELRSSGFRKQPQMKQSWISPQEYVAVFSRAREEIYVALRQEQQGTSVVINRVSALEKLQ